MKNRIFVIVVDFFSTRISNLYLLSHFQVSIFISNHYHSQQKRKSAKSQWSIIIVLNNSLQIRLCFKVQSLQTINGFSEEFEIFQFFDAYTYRVLHVYWIKLFKNSKFLLAEYAKKLEEFILPCTEFEGRYNIFTLLLKSCNVINNFPN